MRPQSCKSKGRRLQQQIVADLLAAFPQLTEDDVRSTSMGASGEDVQLSAAARDVFPYSVEAKNQERLNVWAAIEQCGKNATSHTPLVVIKKNKSAAFAVLPWEHALRLIVAPRAAPTDRSTRRRLLDCAEELRRVAAALPDE